MGLGNSSVAVAAAAAAVVVVATPKVGVFLENGFFTIGPQNRDLGALLPGKTRTGVPHLFCFHDKCEKSMGFYIF